MRNDLDFADTELAADNVCPLFPMQTPVPELPHVAVHRGFPDADPKARRAPRNEAFDAAMVSSVAVLGERKRQAEALRAASAAGHATGYRKGYKDGVGWGIFVGALLAGVIIGIVGGGLGWFRG